MGVNVLKLSEFLKSNEEETLNVLNSLNLPKLSHNRLKHEVRFSREENTNPTSNSFDLRTLRYYSFSTNESGNLYTLVMSKTGMNFPKSLNYIAKIVRFRTVENEHIVLPFGGFYKTLIRDIEEPEANMQTFPEKILNHYDNGYNLQFVRDGISIQTQEKFQVGLDFDSMRITVPQWTVNGELAGIMGRSIDKDCPHEKRWLPIIPCSRSLTVFGFTHNYKKITEKQICVIFESEKAVMQCDSFGCYVALATCGCHISQTQAKYIKALMTKKIILAYDEGLEEDFVRKEAEKLIVNNKIIKNKVGYVFDKENKYLPKNSKLNAADMGKEVFKKITKECVIWIN